MDMTPEDMMMLMNFGASPWYLAGGVALGNVLGAYAAKGAANFASSKINLALPGTRDLTDGIAIPTWDIVNGWSFTGASSQYLMTSIALQPLGNNWTVIMSVTGINRALAQSFFGVSSNRGGFGSNASDIIHGNGATTTTLNPTWAAGTLAIYGLAGYYSTTAISIAAGSTCRNAMCAVGAATGVGDVVGGFMTGNIQYLSIYNTTLTQAQVLAIMARITP